MNLCGNLEEQQPPDMTALTTHTVPPTVSQLLPTIPASPVEVIKSQDSGAFIHADDFRSVKYRGIEYSLTKTQALIVKRLHEYHEKGISKVHQDTLLEDLEICSKRLRDVFKGSTAWKELVLPAGKGFFGLLTS